MAVDQLPGQVREFANYLDGLLARLDQGGGWCGVFWQRDPDGMQACLSGREVPPWDVVEALLQDLAAEYGPGAVAQEKDRARALHMAALAAFDARPGSRDALGDRLDVMLREQKYAAERQLKLGQLLNSATTQDAADALRLDLAWAHDDHERATARCAELRARIEELDSLARTRGAGTVQRDRHGNVFRVDDVPAAHRLPRQRDPEDGRHGYDPAGADHQGGEPRRRDNRRGYEEFERANPGFDGQHATPDFGRPEPTSGRGTPDPTGGGFGSPETASGFGAPEPMDEESTGHAPAPDQAAPADPPTSKQRKRRRGSARFAGMAEGDAAAPAPDPAAVVPELPAPAPTARRSPRGARFAGAAARPVERPQPQREPLDADARQGTVEAVQRLVGLRREGRSGEAHALLVEAAYWPAARFPLLAAELQRAGLGADWATLLWEAASLPADRLVGAADALVAAGRTADGEQILRQGVARPAAEIGAAVLALAAEGRRREIRALLDAYVRVRTPEEAARSVAADPQQLVPLLLEAAQGASDECHWDLVHALRVAGFSA
ncbi:hypothetical protein OHT77_09345 [Streptomyces sp. NBC_00252]|uniref:hypothetical protein n=1 Tax=Streptomyces sp. NBC_00252 TaxID=2975691 RepID=UPI002E2904E7|nr:hypothetical protein [Streptomyces sp. NBC_00252]